MHPTAPRLLLDASATLPERLLTSEEVADLLQASESWVIRSDLAYVKLGRLRRYDPQEVRNFIRARSTAHVQGGLARRSAIRKVPALPCPLPASTPRHGDPRRGAWS